MKKALILIFFILLLIALPVHAEKARIEGTVQGFYCVTMGKTCPVDKEDPVIGAERIFVVFTDEKEHYFVPNLDRAIMARYINDQVRVTGNLKEKYNSINADSFEVYEDGKWRTTWTEEMAQDAIKMLRAPGGF